MMIVKFGGSRLSQMCVKLIFLLRWSVCSLCLMSDK